MADLSWPVLLGAIPAVLGSLKTLLPSGERGLARRVMRLGAVRGTLPEGPGRDSVDKTINRLASELAYREDLQARRRVSGTNLAAMVVIAVVGAAIFWWLWTLGPTWLKAVASVVLGFFSLLVVIGGGSAFFEIDEKFGYESPETQSHRRRRG